MSWKCEYKNTRTSNCNQPKAKGSDSCYFHDKVEQGLADADPEGSMSLMPEIKL